MEEKNVMNGVRASGTDGPSLSLTTTSFELHRLTGEKLTAKGIRSLLEMQRFECGLTGRPLNPSTAQLDHMVPLSRGGSHTMDNAEILHEQINRAKGTMTRDEFIAMCREVIAHIDSVQES